MEFPEFVEICLYSSRWGSLFHVLIQTCHKHAYISCIHCIHFWVSLLPVACRKSTLLWTWLSVSSFVCAWFLCWKKQQSLSKPFMSWRILQPSPLYPEWRFQVQLIIFFVWKVFWTFNHPCYLSQNICQVLRWGHQNCTHHLGCGLVVDFYGGKKISCFVLYSLLIPLSYAF